MAQIPHFRYPFTIDGTAAVVEQDSLDEVTQCTYAVLATEAGARQEEPEFGCPDPAFLQFGADVEDMEAAVQQWEPRASLLSEAAWDDLIETVTEKVGLSE